ncbi:MAG TPA: helix-turn-helix domain-containing protein [Rhizomicrobium sp.]|nr:helix-turn-helix domain-containing protein [Rhizomicrobium sp.]
MAQLAETADARREEILDAAMRVFGRYGYRKTSMEDLAAAAAISKQGLYLHFVGKEDVFLAALRKYLDDALAGVDAALTRPGASLHARLLGAMDAWFGRHFEFFTPDAFDVLEESRRMPGHDDYKSAFRGRLAKALKESGEFRRAGNICTPRDVAGVLFLCGLSWKEGNASRAVFRDKMSACIRACCQIEK